MLAVDTFDYEGHSISIVPEMHKGKLQYWFCVDNRPISNVSKRDTAKRVAINFVDVITDSHYATSRTGKVADYTNDGLPPYMGKKRVKPSKKKVSVQ
jgi:hypothetical protein